MSFKKNLITTSVVTSFLASQLSASKVFAQFDEMPPPPIGDFADPNKQNNNTAPSFDPPPPVPSSRGSSNNSLYSDMYILGIVYKTPTTIPIYMRLATKYLYKFFLK